MLAGGVDSMSRIPMLAAGDPLFHDAEVSFALHSIPPGLAADMLATRSGISCDQVDRYAVGSHERAAKAWAAGAFAKSTVPVVDENGDTVLAATRRYHGKRRSRQKIRKGRTVTAPDS